MSKRQQLNMLSISIKFSQNVGSKDVTKHYSLTLQKCRLLSYWLNMSRCRKCTNITESVSAISINILAKCEDLQVELKT